MISHGGIHKRVQGECHPNNYRDNQESDHAFMLPGGH